jgi:hypothetical protein
MVSPEERSSSHAFSPPPGRALARAQARFRGGVAFIGISRQLRSIAAYRERHGALFAKRRRASRDLRETLSIAALRNRPALIPG